jgi:hypothetical protein
VKAIVEWLSNGFLAVSVNGQRHLVSEIRFGYDGQIPTMDLGGYPLGEVEVGEPELGKTMDSAG